MILVALKDNVSGKFDSPALFHNVEDAKRGVVGLIHQNQNFAVNCSDYSIYKLGTYDVETGVIEPCTEFIANCIDFKQ